MKTSFYLLLWLPIAFLLSRLGIGWIDKYALVVSILVVSGIWLALRYRMRGVVKYQRLLAVAPLIRKILAGKWAGFRWQMFDASVIKGVTVGFLLLFLFAAITDSSKSVTRATHIADIAAIIVASGFTLYLAGRGLQFLMASFMLQGYSSPKDFMTMLTDIYRIHFPPHEGEDDLVYYCDALNKPRPRGLTACLAISLGSGLLAILFSLLSFEIISEEGLDSSCFLLYNALLLYYGLHDFLTSIRDLIRSPQKLLQSFNLKRTQTTAKG